MKTVCQNCGADPEATALGDTPVEELVNDEVRQSILTLCRAGVEARHSTCIASNAPVRLAGREFQPAFFGGGA